MVTGGSFGAGRENMMPVRSTLVEGPGTARRSMFSANREETMSMTRPGYRRAARRRRLTGAPEPSAPGPVGPGVTRDGQDQAAACSPVRRVTRWTVSWRMDTHPSRRARRMNHHAGSTSPG